MKMDAARALRRSSDPGLLLTLLLTLFAVLPLALSPGLPNGNQVSLQIWRAEMLQGVELFSSSWVDVLNYTGDSIQSGFDGSLTVILTSGIHLAFGLGALDALRALVVFCLLASSGGMYAFCRRRSGPLGALLAALVYAFSPTLMHTLPYARGAYPVMLALALFPLLLWRVDALRDKPTCRNFLLAFLLQIAMFNTQVTMSLHLTLMALGWVGFETLTQAFNREASQMRAHAGVLALLMLILGAFASTTVWWSQFSAGAWRDSELVNGAGQSVDGLKSVRLETLLSPPPLADAGAINGLREVHSLSLASWLFALAGGISALMLYVRGYRTRHPQAFLGALYFSLSALVLIALTISPPGSDWQYPGLYMGLLTVCLSIVTSMNGIWLTKLERRVQLSAIALVVALPIVTAIPLLYVPEWQATAPDMALRADANVPPRNASELSAVLSALAIAFVCGIAWRMRKTRLTPRPYWMVSPLSRTTVLGVTTGGVLALLCLFITFREGIAWIHSPPGTALPAQIQRRVTLEGGVQLLGYDISGNVFRPGDTLFVSAYWYAPEALTVDYSSLLTVSRDGERVAQVYKDAPGGRPSSQWSPAGYILDRFTLQLPADFLAGDYEIAIGLFDCEGMGCRDEIAADDFDAGFQAKGGSIALTEVRVEAD